MTKEILFIDMDGVLCDFEGLAIEKLGSNLAPENSIERKHQIDDCQRIPNFYKDLKPLPGATEAFQMLSQHYDVYVLSAPSWDNVNSYSDKRIWVEQYLGAAAYKKLILSHNKGLFEGRALIDDRIKYGVENFKGEHIHFGSSMFPDWNSVLKYLIPN